MVSGYNYPVNGQPLLRAGFMMPDLAGAPGLPGISRAAELTRLTEQLTQYERLKSNPEIQRLDAGASFDQITANLRTALAEHTRAITTTTTAFPYRENLEAPAHILVPLETPVRNMLPRVMGSGVASGWRQVTSLGGGYGFLTTVTTGAASATQTVGSTSGMRAGDILQFTTAAGVTIGARTISSITSSTVVVLTATVTTTTGDIAVNTSRPVGAGAGVLSHTQAFFGEGLCPAAHDMVWASKSATYKQLGARSGITALAQAASGTFEDSRARIKTSLLLEVMLLEENSLINGSATATYPPWGDGTTAFGFDGLLNLISTANGTPSSMVQANVGQLTLSHIDRQLLQLFEQGGRENYMIMDPVSVTSLTHLAEASGSIIRIPGTPTGDVTLGVTVTNYKHPVTGQLVPIFASRFLAPPEPGGSTGTGTIIFGSKYLPDGSPAADVSVLPAAPLPELNVNAGIGGYVVQDMAPTIADGCTTYNSLVFVIEVLRLKSAAHFAKSTGITAV